MLHNALLRIGLDTRDDRSHKGASVAKALGRTAAQGALLLTFLAAACAPSAPATHLTPAAAKPPSTGGVVFVSRTGNDKTCVRGDQTRPCLSFGRAYQVARQGDVVRVAAGVYPGQAVGADGSKTSASGHCRLVYKGDGTVSEDDSGCVTFEPAPGASVQVGGISMVTSHFDLAPEGPDTAIPVADASSFYVNGTGSHAGEIDVFMGYVQLNCRGKTDTSLTGCYPQRGCNVQPCAFNSGVEVLEGGLSSSASFVRFRDMTVALGPSSSSSATDVVFDGITSRTGGLHGSYVGLENSAITNATGGEGLRYTACDHCVLYNTTVSGVTKAGVDCAGSTMAPHSGCPHTQGVGFWGPITNLAIVGNRIYDNESENLFFSYGGSNVEGPVYLVNNVIGSTCSGCQSIYAKPHGTDTRTGWVVEGNSTTGSSSWGTDSSATGVTYTNMTFSGNIGIQPPCTRPPGASTYDVTITHNIVRDKPCVSAQSPVASGNLDYRGVVLAWPWRS